MTLDSITREEFQAYVEVQEKKEELKERAEIGEKYNRLAWLSAGAAILSVGASVIGVSTDYVGKNWIIFNGVFSLVNVGFTIYHVCQTRNNSIELSGLEEELEQLKAEPSYKSACPE